MKRKIDAVLEEWATSGRRHPLLVRGARRVGKTYSVKRLGAEVFGEGRFAYCDFQTNLERFSEAFAVTSDVEGIVSSLSLILRKEIKPKETLIAFDEVQLCENALNSLRFFAESDYRVVATGSQLGMTLKNRELPFPSDVSHVYLRPMDFEEFLWAVGQEAVAEGIRDSFRSFRKFILHDEAMRLYETYLMVGGMPKAVGAFAEREGLDAVKARQVEIDETYAADIALYAPADVAVHAQAIWRSIPQQLARESTRKFKYSDVAKGGRERVLRSPLAWLEAAELVNVNYQTNDVAAPLAPRGGGSYFKVYCADTGLMFSRFNLDPAVFADPLRRRLVAPRFRGALAENYVMQALVANGMETFYWTPGTTSQNEVEFVLQNGLGQVVPVEVKSGDNVRSRSLNAYRERSGAPCAIRLSAKNFGKGDGVLSIPLYAAFCIDGKALMDLAVE